MGTKLGSNLGHIGGTQAISPLAIPAPVKNYLKIHNETCTLINMIFFSFLPKINGALATPRSATAYT